VSVPSSPRRFDRLKTRAGDALARATRGRSGRGPAPARGSQAVRSTEFQALAARVDQLEAMLEGLQDAMHRESSRTNQRVDDLARSVRPDQLARALSDDARRRGL
jgi:hypothetical protein